MTFPDADWLPTNGSTSTTAEGDIDAPIVIPRIPSSIAGAIVTGGQEAAVERRWGLIEAVRPAESKVDLNLGGTIIESVARVASYIPFVGQLVRVDVVGSDIIVVGPIAPDYANQFAAERLGTVLSIAVNGTLQVQFPDDTSVVTARRLTSYIPWAGDAVRVIQHLDDFLVLGTVATTATDHRCPTGDVELTFRSAAKAGTIFLQGQTLSRATYARLWAHVQAENGLASGYGPGNGSTTFTVPDMRGAVPIGATTGAGPDSQTYGLGTIIGAATRTLAITNMPAHTHNVVIGNHATHVHGVTVAVHATHDHSASGTADAQGTHNHPFSTNGAGNHGGHHPTSQVNAAAGPDLGLSPWNAPGVYLNDHAHSGTTNNAGNHGHNISINIDPISAGAHTVNETANGPTVHSVGQDTVGSGTPIDIRQRSIAVNYMIWT